MLQEYDACPAREKNLLLQSGIFPFPPSCPTSFSFWESSMHVAKEHPLFKGLRKQLPDGRTLSRGGPR